MIVKPTIIVLVVAGIAGAVCQTSSGMSPVPVPAAEKLMPVDIASSDPGLVKVRDQILEAAKERRFEMLVPVLGPSINVDFNNYSPRDFLEVARKWPADEVVKFWRDVRDVLRLGMAQHPQEDIVYAPYVFVGLERMEGDVAITGEHVPAFAAPSRTARVIGFLSYDVVESAPAPNWTEARPMRIDSELYGWRRVVLPSGKTGWVSEKYARSELGRRLAFQKIDGEWKLVAIAIGD